jgi:hypothetical protein
MGRYLDLIRNASDAEKAKTPTYEENELNEQSPPVRPLNSFSSFFSYPRTFGGGIPQAWVDGVAQLHPARPPADVPPGRWRRLLADIVRFIDSDFAASATALGWDPIDLFGCDAERPYARLDQAGLLWMLGAGRLIALTANTATIEFPTGSRQIWRRRSSGPGRVLAWQLAGR